MISTAMEIRRRIPNHEKEEQVPESSAFPLPNLPSEIIEDILSRLPVKSLIRFRSVSKPWLTLLTTDSTFIQKHLHLALEHDENHCLFLEIRNTDLNKYYSIIPKQPLQSPLPLDTPCLVNSVGLRIFGSCNGLVSLYSTSYEDETKYGSLIYIWNPATRQCKTLPRPNILSQTNSDAAAFDVLGFCFNSIMDDYKVVRVVHFNDGDDNGEDLFHIEVEVYSLSTNSWKRVVGTFPYYIMSSWTKAVMDGVFHFLGSRGDMVFYEFILSFDLANETFREVPMPILDILDVYDMDIRVYRGCVSLIVVTKEFEFELWIMKEYGVKNSWTKLFVVDDETILFSIDFVINGDLLFDPNGDIIVNYENKEFKTIQIPKLGKGDAIPYVESLVQLPATVDDVKELGSVEKM